MRLPKKLKEDADAVFEEIGLDMPTAFRAFLKASVRRKGMPFALHTVDENGFTPEEAAEVQKAYEESFDPKNWVGPFHDSKSLIASLHAK
jgi:addiction module RelB/DinJ family antitoxin